jgi:hypothetical protein
VNASVTRLCDGRDFLNADWGIVLFESSFHCAMIDIENDVFQILGDSDHHAFFFPDYRDHRWLRADPSRVRAHPTLYPEGCPEERIEAAALSAWDGVRPGCVAGEAAYGALKGLYFALHKRLFPHSKRSMFTKDECALFLDLLLAQATDGRGRRQPAQALNARLKGALAAVSAFHTGCLQEAAKKCALALGGSGAASAEPGFVQRPQRR